jgi:hypothetical protein
MSGGQDPVTMEWEILTAETEMTLAECVKHYLTAIDNNNMVIVYSMRSLMRQLSQDETGSDCKKCINCK